MGLGWQNRTGWGIAALSGAGSNKHHVPGLTSMHCAHVTPVRPVRARHSLCWATESSSGYAQSIQPSPPEQSFHPIACVPAAVDVGVLSGRSSDCMRARSPYPHHHPPLHSKQCRTLKLAGYRASHSCIMASSQPLFSFGVIRWALHSCFTPAPRTCSSNNPAKHLHCTVSKAWSPQCSFEHVHHTGLSVIDWTAAASCKCAKFHTKVWPCCSRCHVASGACVSSWAKRHPPCLLQ